MRKNRERRGKMEVQKITLFGSMNKKSQGYKGDTIF
jgi:hypothetical protein